MPNIITHKIFAETVMSTFPTGKIRSLLAKHEQLFGIGANGPDFLFFYHMRPWELWKEHSLNHIGSALHSAHVNDFYESAVMTMRRETDEQIRERELVYVMGHLCHWALDMTSHPYIFYRTGNGRGISAARHHRFESVLDAVMLKQYLQCDIRDYQTFKICHFDRDMLQAIARIYVPAVADALGEIVDVYSLHQALAAWEDVQKLLYDPTTSKYSLLRLIERMIHKPGLVSGNIIPCEDDDALDVLNLRQQLWLHPCDARERHHCGFLYLFANAQQLAKTAITCVDECVAADGDPQSLLNLLADRAYDSGRKGEVEMRYFDEVNDETV